MMQVVGAVFIVALGIAGLMSLRRPAWAAGIVIMMFTLEQVLQSMIPVLSSHSWITNVMIALIALAAVLARFMRGEHIFEGYYSPVLILVCLIYAWQIIGIFWSPGGPYALATFKKNTPYLVLFILILPMLVRSVDEFTDMAKFILFFGLAVVLLVLLNPSADFAGSRFRVDVGVESETFANPLATAGTGGAVAITAVLAHFEKKSLVLLLFRIAAFCAGMGIAILSGSRGQAFGAALVIILLYPVARRVADPKQFFIVAGGFLVVIAAVYFAFSLFLVSENTGRFTSGVDESLSDRWNRVTLMLETYIGRPQNWLQGIGPGGYSALTGDQYAHNVPVEVTVELGLIGLALFCCAGLIIFLQWRKVLKVVADNPSKRSFVAVLAGYFVYHFILSCKQGSIIGSVGPMAQFVLIGSITYQFLRMHALEAHHESEPEEYGADAEGEFDYSEYGDFTDYGDYRAEPAT